VVGARFLASWGCHFWTLFSFESYVPWFGVETTGFLFSLFRHPAVARASFAFRVFMLDLDSSTFEFRPDLRTALWAAVTVHARRNDFPIFNAETLSADTTMVSNHSQPR
jgi:hypothetical protein